MITIPQIRNSVNQIIVSGNHEPIVQSILDFDYLSGKKEGSIVAIITGRRGFAKYFFGHHEILIPTYPSLTTSYMLRATKLSNLWLLNLLSGRRTLSSTLELLESNIWNQKSNLAGAALFADLPAKATGSRNGRIGSLRESPVAKEGNVQFVGGALFAENVPELHSLQIISTNQPSKNLIVGPASVGLLVPGLPRHPAGALKLGPIGGITPTQILEGKITEPGGVAVLSASGGMTNELMNIACSAGHRLSFALSFGGDRFPVLSPRDAFLLAESDPETKTVLYYGELGGEDEYELVKLKEEGKFTKKVVAHIAGTVAGLFPESPQFGHAKARADKERTTATAKRSALASAGFQVSRSFSEFINLATQL